MKSSLLRVAAPRSLCPPSCQTLVEIPDQIYNLRLVVEYYFLSIIVYMYLISAKITNSSFSRMRNIHFYNLQHKFNFKKLLFVWKLIYVNNQFYYKPLLSYNDVVLRSQLLKLFIIYLTFFLSFLGVLSKKCIQTYQQAILCKTVSYRVARLFKNEVFNVNGCKQSYSLSSRCKITTFITYIYNQNSHFYKPL